MEQLSRANYLSSLGIFAKFFFFFFVKVRISPLVMPSSRNGAGTTSRSRFCQILEETEVGLQRGLLEVVMETRLGGGGMNLGSLFLQAGTLWWGRCWSCQSSRQSIRLRVYVLMTL